MNELFLAYHIKKHVLGMEYQQNNVGCSPLAEHAAPVYHTKNMEKTVEWFENVLGWYAGVDAKDENGVGTYRCALSFPGELVHANIENLLPQPWGARVCCMTTIDGSVL